MSDGNLVLADAAYAAGRELVTPPTLMVIGLENAPSFTAVSDMVAFVRCSGDVSGEALFRWAAARGSIPFLGTDWARVSDEIRLFFNSFTAVVKALAPLLEPPAETRTIPANPQPAPERRDNTIYETAYKPIGAGSQKTHHDAHGPRSTSEVYVARPGDPLAGAVAAVVAPEAPQSIDPREQLRLQAKSLPGDVSEIEKAPPPRAPAIGAVAAVSVQGKTEETSGVVAVSRPAR